MNRCYTVSLFSDLAASSVSAGPLGNGLQMTILSALGERLSVRKGSADLPQPPDDAPAASAGETQVPFAGYDRLDDREVIHGLSDHSQIELEAVESYERSHQNREPVLDKLRWMRGREPLAGYDTLSVEEIGSALENADMATIKKVRAYERKFANRPDVLEGVVRAHHRRQATQPATVAPSYQPMSASAMGATVVNSRGDRTERGRP
jgi:hypothetical protein